MKTDGLGGGIQVTFSCSGCAAQPIHFGTTFVEGSRRTVVGLSTAVAFIIAGSMYSGYHKTLKLGLGISALSHTAFAAIIKLLYKPVRELLESQTELVRELVKTKDEVEIGSAKRLVTTSDGVWQTRGFFSNNFTFTIWDYLSGGLLYFLHLCQRGSEDVVEEGLYGGTSKSAEGFAAEKTFQKIKDDGLHVEVNWQDADSSSGNAFAKVFPPSKGSKVMLCGGHVNRAHTKRLQELAKQKAFTAAFKNRHRESYPEVDTVACTCAGKNHKKGCGCLNEQFIRQARRNLFCALIESGKNADRFDNIMHELGQYHSRDQHAWDEDKKCSFHAEVVCSCGKCEDDNALACVGQPYRSKYKLSCLSTTWPTR